jgi:4-hydroxybutyrate CoA-transferase
VQKSVTAEEAVKAIRSGRRVYIHGIAAAPQALIKAMTARADELRDVEVVHLHTEGPAPYAAPEMKDSFRVNSLFVGGNVRDAIREGRGDYVPIFLSEVPNLFRSGMMPIDVALMQVSPPDKHGFCSLGVSVEASLAAMQSAQYVIAQVNHLMPRTFGDGLVHVNDLDAIVEFDEPIGEIHALAPTDVESKIGLYCAELIDDGATLQMGIGAIPNAVLASLTHHKNLGVHTEMFSDGLIPLVESGVVNGREKKLRTGKIVSGFVWGTRKLYDFVDENPQISMLDIAYVNDTSVIRRNPKVTAINSAIEVDVTGQVCADSIGTQLYSGVGGQMDFIRGASLSEGGKPIIALPSTTGRGVSRIVSELKPGAGVVTTRAHVHYVVTEYGIANLYGMNLRQRANAMIQIAHPDHREGLEAEAFERFGALVR